MNRLMFKFIFICPEINETAEGQHTVKQYFLSERITYSWLNAYVSCKAVGLKLAYISSEDELQNLVWFSRRKIKHFNSNFYVDGFKFMQFDGEFEKQKPVCLAFQKKLRGTFETKRIECASDASAFLCESIDVVNDYGEKAALEAADVNVKATFLQPLAQGYSQSAIRHSKL